MSRLKTLKKQSVSARKKCSLREENSLERCEREIKLCEDGWAGIAPSWLYLMGWADWQMQKREILRLQQVHERGLLCDRLELRHVLRDRRTISPIAPSLREAVNAHIICLYPFRHRELPAEYVRDVQDKPASRCQAVIRQFQ